jgi:hypothetical protein
MPLLQHPRLGHLRPAHATAPCRVHAALGEPPRHIHACKYALLMMLETFFHICCTLGSWCQGSVILSRCWFLSDDVAGAHGTNHLLVERLGRSAALGGQVRRLHMLIQFFLKRGFEQVARRWRNASCCSRPCSSFPASRECERWAIASSQRS